MHVLALDRIEPYVESYTRSTTPFSSRATIAAVLPVLSAARKWKDRRFPLRTRT